MRVLWSLQLIKETAAEGIGDQIGEGFEECALFLPFAYQTVVALTFLPHTIVWHLYLLCQNTPVSLTRDNRKVKNQHDIHES